MPRDTYAEAFKIMRFLSWANQLEEDFRGVYLVPRALIPDIRSAAARIERQAKATSASGSSKSEAKQQAARENGRKNKGRPKKT